MPARCWLRCAGDDEGAMTEIIWGRLLQEEPALPAAFKEENGEAVLEHVLEEYFRNSAAWSDAFGDDAEHAKAIIAVKCPDYAAGKYLVSLRRDLKRPVQATARKISAVGEAI